MGEAGAARIRILPEILSNKIAAGEVVERPSSVIKELVENAIDAGSDRISVDIEDGGRKLIRVSDNGYGMSHDDALLAIERYATSKIASESDLLDIRSLGFRGEALPSIASVSRFTMITRDELSDAGTEIQVEGGKIRAVNPAGAPRGTMIEVRQLFFNTPARRKFMKTAATEFGHVADTLSCIALSRPEIRFSLTHNGKTVRQWHNVRSPEARMADVLGASAVRLLYPVQGQAPAASLSGWICDPSVNRATAGKIYIFVNGRFIRDRGIVHAVIDGFSGRLMKGRFPVAVLYLDVPAGEVDVNVHPTKHEVRFARRRDIYTTVNTAVARALADAGTDASANRDEHSSDAGRQGPAAADRPAPATFHGAKDRAPEQSARMQETVQELSEKIPAFENPAAHESAGSFAPDAAAQARRPVKSGQNMEASPPLPQQPSLFGREDLGRAHVIGQFRNSYILCEKDDELLLIDQHAAHERILYEQFRRRAASGDVSVQRLLVPETVETGFRESAALEAMLPGLKRAGLEIEPFGPNTFAVHAVPDILADRPAGPLLLEIAEVADATGYRQKGVERAIDACLLLMACHGAVRANQPLAEKQMKAIVDGLLDCENPSTCPHGRPIRIAWSKAFLDRHFKRVV